MPSMITGDGEHTDIFSFKETIDKEGIPSIIFKLYAGERFKQLFVQDITQIDESINTVTRIYSKIFLVQLNSSKTKWLCTKDFNNKTTELSRMFSHEDDQLVSLYKRSARLQRAINWTYKKIDEIKSRPLESMMQDIHLRQISAIARARYVSGEDKKSEDDINN